jgi:uncharacterized repeat protein (TIGR03806 family)
MRSTSAAACFGASALFALLSCGDDATPIAITDAPNGMDARPANPTCVAPGRPPSTVDVRFERAFEPVALKSPIAMVQIPGDASRFFVVERAGRVVSFPASAPTVATPVLDITSKVNAGGEGGLLSVAFHPKFKDNGFLYASYTIHGAPNSDMRSIVTRFTSTDGGKTFGSETDVIAAFDQPYTNHKGGNLAFGPDGFLYAGFGDGGSGGDPLDHGQNTNLLFSKILRIDVDGPAPYGIPNDNPFKNGGGAPETFAYGFRNPWRFSFDRGTGDLWVADVGQDAWEEIDLVKRGGNYGWNAREGTHCFDQATCQKGGLVDPIYEYDHSEGKSITGGYVYRGTKAAPFIGTYVFADFVLSRIWALVDGPDGKKRAVQLNTNGPTGGWASFAEDEAGELYVIDLAGKIYAMVAGTPTPGGGNAAFPQKLSETGCFEKAHPDRPLPGTIPYGVSSPLWSDGATKDRWLAIPDGKTIHVGADGDWELPVGSVLVKTFHVAGKKIETRLFMRHDDGDWAGYTYEWSDDESDAQLLPSGKTKKVGDGTWTFPSRSECLACHTVAAGRSLGLEDGQLNGTFVYPTGANAARRSNQLTTLDHIGLFDAPHAAAGKTVAFPAPIGAGAPLEARAKSYLHANCSHCHRPEGTGGGPMDFRFATPVATMQTCGLDPQQGDLGVAGAKILAPGDPSHSILSLRPRALDSKRMPPLASRVVDEAGVSVLDDWIRSLASCPP